MSRASRAALRAYPPSFKARYGEELTALLDDVPTTQPVTTDLLVGAARAWLRPCFSGPDARRGRLQATVTTTWVAWCAGFLAAPAINRALLDAPVPGATPPVRDLLGAAQVLFFVGWAIALLGAVPLVARGVLPAVRAGSWRPLYSLLPTLGLGTVELALGGVLALTRGSIASDPTPLFLTLGAIWLAGLFAFVTALGFGPAIALQRFSLHADVLRPAALLAVPLALTLTASTGCCLAAVAMAGDATILGSGMPVILVLAVALVASLTALTSTSRGVRAARRA